MRFVEFWHHLIDHDPQWLYFVVLGDEHSQAAQMTLAAGETEGSPNNRHRGADEWAYVVSGRLRDFRYAPPLATRARILSMAVTSTGFVRWKSNPASLDCRLLSSLPQPVRATSTAPLSDGSPRNRFATS